jgi:superkiller protein 3
MKRSRWLSILLLLLFWAVSAEAASNEAVKRSNFGGELLKQGRLEEAAAEFQRAVDADPNFATAYLNLGYALDKLSRRDEAIAAYKKGVVLDPRSAFGFNNLGVLSDQAGRHDEAIQALETALQLEPSNASIQQNLQHARKNKALLQERQDMIADLQQQAAARPTDPVPARELLRLYAIAGQQDQALEWLQKTLARGWRDIQGLKADRNLAAFIRTDPRFSALLEGR